jgi:hypothetical protein
MKKSAFGKNFPAGVAVPPLLSDLLEYQNYVDKPYGGRFWLTDGGRATALASFDGDTKAATQFVLFGGDPDGSSYGFWLASTSGAVGRSTCPLTNEAGTPHAALTLDSCLGQDSDGYAHALIRD